MQTMDYSFLLGIHKVEPQTSNRVEKRLETSDRGYFSYSFESIYYFGIIDYLIRYDVAKKEEISSVAPQDYANRFAIYLEKKIWSPDNDSNGLTPRGFSFV